MIEASGSPVEPGVGKIPRGQVDAVVKIAHARIADEGCLQRYQWQGWQIVTGDLLDLPELIRAPRFVALRGCLPEQLINRRVIVVGRVDIGQRVLDSVRPVDPLHADRRVEQQAEPVEVDVEITVVIDPLDEGAEIAVEDVDADAGTAEGGPQVAGSRLECGPGMRSAQCKPDAAASALQSRLIEKAIGLVEIEGMVEARRVEVG